MKKNKKDIILTLAIIAVFSLIIAIFAVVFFDNTKAKQEFVPETTTTPETQAEQTTEPVTLAEETSPEAAPTKAPSHNIVKPTEKPAPKPQLVPKKKVVIDNTFEVISVSDYGGRLGLKIKNISNEDIEYAVIRCSADSKSASFTVTALLKGKTALAVSNENISLENKMSIKKWTIDNKITYKEELSLHKNEIAINAQTGSLQVTNTSDKDIGTIFICYKKVTDGVYFAQDTYRVTVDSLKKGETKTVAANRFTKGVHEIIFVDYEN